MDFVNLEFSKIYIYVEAIHFTNNALLIQLPI